MKHFALIGDPVSHSLSPLIYRFLFEEYGVEADFSLLQIPKGRVEEVLAHDLDGFACTMPHKEAIIAHLGAISDEATAMNSVNIVKRTEFGLEGHSTDGEGLRLALGAKTAVEGKNIFILGSGGAARAAVFALKKDNHVTVFARNPEAREKLAQSLDVVTLPIDELESCMEQCDIFINATPQGMKGKGEFESLDFIGKMQKSAAVCDMVYNPRVTKLLQAAEEEGLAVIEGIDMLVMQAYAAFEIWFGIKPDAVLLKDRLYSKIEQELKERGK